MPLRDVSLNLCARISHVNKINNDIFCVQSDALCGSLHCDISAISQLQYANFDTNWTTHVNWTLRENVVCTIASYKTFYNGPNRPDPGFVPDGAACGTGKVTIIYDEKSSLHVK